MAEHKKEESSGIWEGKTSEGKPCWNGTLPIMGKFILYDNGIPGEGSRRPRYSFKLIGTKGQTASFTPSAPAVEDDLPF